MPTKVLFMPWPHDEASTYDGKCQSWINVDDDYEMAYYTAAEIAQIKGLGFWNTLYLRGHGGVGSPTIQNDSGALSSLNYKQVANRLITSGLKKTFAGAIKMYNCHSGEKADDQTLSFAKLFAMYMYQKKGYWLCSFYGYVGELSSDYFKQSDYAITYTKTHKKAHKFTNVNDEWTRASDKRKRFFGVVGTLPDDGLPEN